MTEMQQYVEDILASIEKKDPQEKEYHNVVKEVLTSIVPVLEQHPEYKKHKILERMVEPERVVMFRVPWETTKARFRSTAATACRRTAPSAPTRAACASIRA